MKSLLSNYVLSILSGWTDFLENIKKITENCGELNSQNDEENIFPVEIYGLEGASVSFFAGENRLPFAKGEYIFSLRLPYFKYSYGKNRK